MADFALGGKTFAKSTKGTVRLPVTIDLDG